MIEPRSQDVTAGARAPTRRAVVLGAMLGTLFPFPERRKTTMPADDRIVIRNGWVLLESDLS